MEHGSMGIWKESCLFTMRNRYIADIFNIQPGIYEIFQERILGQLSQLKIL